MRHIDMSDIEKRHNQNEKVLDSEHVTLGVCDLQESHGLLLIVSHVDFHMTH